MVNNSENKENVSQLEPSKAWIRNIGPGSSRKYPKNRFSRSMNVTANMTPVKTPQKDIRQKLAAMYKTKTNDTTQTPQRDCTVIELNDMDLVPDVNASHSLFVEETVIEEDTTNVEKTVIVEETVDNTEASLFIDTQVDETAFQSCVGNDTVTETLSISGIEALNDTEIDTTVKESDQNRAVNKTVIDRPEPAISSESFELIEISSDTSSVLFDATDEIAAESTFLPLNSTIASTTCIQMQVAANNLRNMYISNDAKKTQDSDEFEPDLTLVPTYTQFLNDKNNKDWTLRSPPKATSWKQGPEIPSASSDGLIQVYMREQDINRMLNKGNIYFAQGKLHYAESTQRKRTF